MYRVRKQLLAVAGCLSTGMMLLAYPQAWSASGVGASFFDDFAIFNLRRWFISDGWNSGDFQDCTYSRKGLKVVDGALELTLSDTPTGKTPYTCAELQTKAEFGWHL